jgi:hypothetical protein
MQISGDTERWKTRKNDTLRVLAMKTSRSVKDNATRLWGAVQEAGLFT